VNAEYKLIDGWVRNREHPTTFEIPGPVELMDLANGVFVKLGVENGEGVHGERFWVEVTDLGLTMCGIVRQADVVFTHRHGVADGDEIFFERRHILGINVRKDFEL
jgi:hypothetical protein